jgi:hypothetical protein
MKIRRVIGKTKLDLKMEKAVFKATSAIPPSNSNKKQSNPISPINSFVNNTQATPHHVIVPHAQRDIFFLDSIRFNHLRKEIMLIDLNAGSDRSPNVIFMLIQAFMGSISFDFNALLTDFELQAKNLNID